MWPQFEWLISMVQASTQSNALLLYPPAVTPSPVYWRTGGDSEIIFLNIFVRESAATPWTASLNGNGLASLELVMGGIWSLFSQHKKEM
jgi:hypothetical protein